MIRTILFAALLFIGTGLFAQNETNAEGRRVGYWKVTAADDPKAGYSPDALVEEGKYEVGRKVGVWKAYFPSGKIKSEITYITGRPKGPYTTYYENGQIRREGKLEPQQEPRQVHPAITRTVRYSKTSHLMTRESATERRNISTKTVS